MKNHLKIKVCGMREEANITNLIKKVQPDFIGLIFYKKSKRLIEKRLQPQTLELIKNNSQLVGVFVEQTIKEILFIARQYQLDWLQLHGGERHNYQFCQHLKSKGHKIIKVLRINNQTDINQELNHFAEHQELNNAVDCLMFDTDSAQYGGLGEEFDWSVIPPSVPLPFFLSGGLSLDNLECLRAFIKKRKKNNQSIPYALDLNSKFEIGPGFKDIEKLNRFINQLVIGNN